MRWRTPVSTALFAFLTLAAPVFAEIPAAQRRVLESTAEVYNNARSFLLSGTIEITQMSNRGPQSQTANFLVAAGPGGRLRDEVTGGGATGMFVSNGKETWVYNGTVNQYLHKPGGADSVLKMFPNRGVGSLLVSRYTHLLEGANGASFLSDTTFTVNGERRACDVVEVTYDPPQGGSQVKEDARRFWIDQKTHLVVRARTSMHADTPQFGRVDQVETITFARATVEPTFPDSLWVFKAPDGATQVEEFNNNTADAGAAFRGKPAIDFTLKDLKGRPRSLKSLRGKTVLLDFWATWCGPCRITMPQVAKIHEQYKSKGVEVMSINIGESAKKAGDYITKNGYAFSTLLDEDRTVATQYRVNGIPTLVVIDASGKVSDYMVGVRDEAALKAALQKAGVK